MKLAKVITIGRLALISSLLITGMTGCTLSTASPYDNPTQSSATHPAPPLRSNLVQAWKWNPYENEYYDSNSQEYDPVTHAYKDLPRPLPADFPPGIYPEPSVKPTGLPSEAKWNPYTNGWYDSSSFEYDPVTNSYKDIPGPLPPQFQNAKSATQTSKEWIEQHQNSTDEIDIAIIQYLQAIGPYREKLRKEDPTRYEDHGVVTIGQEEGGPFELLTGLGIPKLQGLVDKVQWENPFVALIEIAVEDICRNVSSSIGPLDFQVTKWKQVFNEKASGTYKYKVSVIAQELSAGTVNEKTTHWRFTMLGIFALPEVYELVINQGNTDLIKYLPDILPLDKMKEYNIKAGETNDAALKQALASSKNYIAIIKTLHAD